MIAEIYHKFYNLEDELTGNFFGTLRYIPFRRGLQRILHKYLHDSDHRASSLIKEIRCEDYDIEFWKRSDLGYGEIDGYLRVDGNSIGIEVKYHSALSGEDQLEREAMMLNEWEAAGKKLLILVADADDAKEIYQRNSWKPCFEKVILSYISWQDMLLGLDEIETVSYQEELMVEDLKLFLKEKGFVGFHGFEDGGLTIDERMYYEFG